ncbi:MAG: hypothetical protein GON13_02765 [Nanoarchaeota archaeon]|nr:hypothetical protein [Nanoarchaeota archaeon]
MKEQTLRLLEEAESSELKLNLITGNVWLKFKNGYEDGLDEPSGTFRLESLPKEHLGLLKGGLTSKLFYLFLLRPHNKYTLAQTYYNKKTNLARSRLDKSLVRLEKTGLLRSLSWDPVFKKSYGLTGRSRYIYTADFSLLLDLWLSEGEELKWEYYFLKSFFKTVNLSKLFLEWDTKEVRKRDIDIVELFKSKFFTLLTLALFSRLKYGQAWESIVKTTENNFVSLLKKTGFLLQYVDPISTTSYLLTKLVQSLTPAMMDEMEVFLRRFYGEQFEPIFHTVVLFLYLPAPLIEDLISKLLLF